jgi:HEAT repeat protein
VLRARGAEAAPYLAASLGKKPGIAYRIKSVVGPRIPPMIKKPFRRFFDPTQTILDKHSAAEALRIIGTNGATAVPQLGTLLNDGNTLLSMTASRALAQMGPAAVPELTSALTNQNFIIRAAACDGLATLGPAAAPAAARLAKIIETEVGPITSSAALALARIGESAVPVLLPLFKDTNWSVRVSAAYALGCAGHAGKTAAPTLTELVTSDPHPKVRAAALDAMGRIDPLSREIVQIAGSALDDPDPEMRGVALQLLRYRPKYVLQNPEKIIARLDDESAEVRGYAALAIASAPAQASNAMGKLEQMAAGTNKVLQAQAREALKIIRNSGVN